MSQDGINLRASLKSMDFEWCLPALPLSQKHNLGETQINMDNMSLLSFQTLGDKGHISHPSSPITKVPNSPF